MDDATMRHDFDDTIVLSVCYLLQVLQVTLNQVIGISSFEFRVEHHAGLVTDYETTSKKNKGIWSWPSIAIVI